MPILMTGFSAALTLAIEQIDQLDHLLRGAHRALAMVGQRHRRAEDRHQAVTHHQRDDAAVAADRVEHQRRSRC